MTKTNTKEALKNLTGCDVRSLTIKKDKIYFTLRGSLASYDEGLLSRLIKIRDVLHAKDLNMPSHYHVEGCPTCNFGAYDDYDFEAIL